MNFDYAAVQYKARDLQREADQYRLAREAQAEPDPYRSLILNLEKIFQQITERYTRKRQLPVAPAAAEVCCSPA